MNKFVIAIITAIVVLGAGAGAGIYLINKANDNVNTTPTTLATDEPIQNRQQITERNCLADTCLQIPNLNYPVASLPVGVQTALSQVLSNEYKLQAYYQAVINKFGDKRPFAMIIGAEDQHVSVVTSLFDKYGLTIPSNPWANKTYSLTTFQSSCQTGAAYEQDTVNLINSLIPQVTNYPDITQVFTSIRDASQTNHLPALQKCS